MRPSKIIGDSFIELNSHPPYSLHEPGMDEVARRMALVGRCYKSRTFRVVDMQVGSSCALVVVLKLTPP